MIEAVFFLKWGYGFPDLPRRLPYLLITVSWRSFQSLRPLLLGTSLIAALIPLLPFLSFFLFPCKTMHDWRNIGKFPIPPLPSLLLLLLFRLPAYLPALPLSPPPSKRIDCSLTCSLARLLNNYLLARSSVEQRIACLLPEQQIARLLVERRRTACSVSATTTGCLLEKPRRQTPLHIPEKETNGFGRGGGGGGWCLLEFGAKKQGNNIARYFGVQSNFLYYRKKKPHKLLMIPHYWDLGIQ